ncbi:uncharacterized protein PG986_007142 [Apiospora aurea]|uniref:Cep57 centrosome microtubule-binding domain-containing protein n=1 Tax=Apiospora aurea TaxID=335848 RepID=A0ABR1QBQ7_9PEZI
MSCTPRSPESTHHIRGKPREGWPAVLFFPPTPCPCHAHAPARHRPVHTYTPHHISSLEWTFGDATANPVAQSKLGGNLTRLQLRLNEPAQVIVPDQVPLKPKKPATATVVKALESLTTALDLTIYLEHTTLSKARLGSLAEAIRSGLSRPVARYGDLHRLYKGMGGSILPVIANPDNAVSDVPAPARADSPPSYDEIGPGPPMPPLAPGHAKAPDLRKRPYKRRRRQCSASSTQTDDDTALPTHMPGRRMDEADVAIVDLDATAAQQGECLSELEDSLASLQEDWESLSGRHAPELEQVKEELRAEVMSRLRNALDSP